MVSFAVQKLLSLIRFHLFIFAFVSTTLELNLKNIAAFMSKGSTNFERQRAAGGGYLTKQYKESYNLSRLKVGMLSKTE